MTTESFINARPPLEAPDNRLSQTSPQIGEHPAHPSFNATVHQMRGTSLSEATLACFSPAASILPGSDQTNLPGGNDQTTMCAAGSDQTNPLQQLNNFLSGRTNRGAALSQAELGTIAQTVSQMSPQQRTQFLQQPPQGYSVEATTLPTDPPQSGWRFSYNNQAIGMIHSRNGRTFQPGPLPRD